MSSFVTSADGTQIAYDVLGEGPGVVLVAGAMQFRGFDPTTVKMSHHLADLGYRVINFDRRGRGESFKTAQCTLKGNVEDIAALARTLDGRVALFGNSSGAALSLAAATDGLNVSSLVLWEAPLGPELADDGAANLAGLREKLRSGSGADAVEYFMKDMPPEWLAGAKAGPGWPVMTAMAPSLEADFEALAWTQSAPRKELWSSITAPALALVGTQTLPIMPPAAESIASNVADGYFGTLEAANHGWDPEVMAQRIADFLQDPAN